MAVNERKAAAAAVGVGGAAGTAAALIIMVLFSFVSVRMQSVQMGMLLPVNITALCIGAFAGAVVCGVIRKQKGLVYGAVCSGAIFVVFAGLSLAAGAVPGAETLLRLAVMVPAGALGGAVGVNLKKKRKRRRK